MRKTDVSDGKGLSQDSARDATRADERVPGDVVVSREDLTSLLTAGIACGMPEPNSPAWEVWLDVVYQRPNLPAQADNTPGGHQAGEFFFDDPDAERAWIALSFAHRRWAERATLSGAREAVAIERLLRLAMLAGRGQLPQEERDRRIQAVVKVADGATEYLREWTAANRKEFMDGLVRDARDRASQSARSRGMKDPVAAATDLERAAYARLAVDWMMFHMRSRFHVPEEFWEASDLARLVLSRASDALMGWSSSAAIYPNRATVCDGGDSLPCMLVGTLSRGLPEETHTGMTPVTRAARANSVACAVAAELNKRREDMYQKLFAAECSDVAAPSPRGPTTHRDKARQWAAKRIAMCAFAGLYVANGESTEKARRKAENMIGRKG